MSPIPSGSLQPATDTASKSAGEGASDLHNKADLPKD